MLFNFSRLTIIILVLTSCQQNHTKIQVESERNAIGNSLETDPNIDNFIAPYRMRLEASMNEKLTYSIAEFNKKQGDLNTAIGNLMADAVFEQTAPVLRKRHNLNLDLVLLNHGGIRAPLPKGSIDMKTPFSIMPFENKVVVVQMRGKAITNMVDYLVKAKRAHPISGMTLQISKDGKVNLFQIQNKPFDPEKTYNIATNDYLYKGGDRMNFFMQSDTVFDMNYKIRNVLIDYFKTKDTLSPARDNRFIFTD